MPTRDGGNGSVRVGRVDGLVLLSIHAPHSVDGHCLTLSAEAVQELIAALVKSRREACGPAWSSSS